MKPLVVNVRNLSARVSGVQRYTSEILAHLPLEVDQISPNMGGQGFSGHLWEQSVLPMRVGKRILWSPANTGPLAVKRQVVTIHDLAALDHPQWMNERFAQWYGWLLPRLARQVEHVVVVSEFTKERLIAHSGVKSEKVSVIHNAVDTRFKPSSLAAISLVKDLLNLPSPRYVLSLGSLEPRKNLARLLQAWQRIVESLPDDVWLVVAGAHGSHLVFQDVTFKDLPPRVHMTGFVPEEYVPALYSGAIAFAYLSVYEGFGLPPLEAMACGTPVLTGNVTSLPEVVGDAGMMVDPLNIEAISMSLHHIIEDDTHRQLMVEKGILQAAKFTWPQSARQTALVLNELT